MIGSASFLMVRAVRSVRPDRTSIIIRMHMQEASNRTTFDARMNERIPTGWVNFHRLTKCPESA